MFFESIQSIKHERFECTFHDLKFTKEIRKGLFKKVIRISRSCYNTCEI